MVFPLVLMLVVFLCITKLLVMGILISFIKEAAIQALNNAEEVEVSFTKVHVNNVTVIGEEKFFELSLLIDKTLSLMKRIAPFIYIPTFIAATLPFYFIR